MRSAQLYLGMVPACCVCMLCSACGLLVLLFPLLLLHCWSAAHHMGCTRSWWFHVQASRLVVKLGSGLVGGMHQPLDPAALKVGQGPLATRFVAAQFWTLRYPSAVCGLTCLCSAIILTLSHSGLKARLPPYRWLPALKLCGV